MNTQYEKEYILSKGYELNEKVSHNDYNLYVKSGKYGRHKFKQQITQYINGDRKGFYIYDNAIVLGTFEALCDVTMGFDYNEYKLFKRLKMIKKVIG